MARTIDLDKLTCPLPLRDYPSIVLGHGGGGQLTAELIEHLFVPAFRNDVLEGLGDAAVLPPISGSIALTTDSFVVRPLFFPGGCIGDLAVHGTVNDLAMAGARPLFLTAGFIIEEGFPLDRLHAIAGAMATAAREAGVQIVTGDTKVVERGHGDGCYVNTAGIGAVRPDVRLAPRNARPGDAVIVSGTIADHGMAIMSVREGLEFESVIRSDSASLNGLVELMLETVAPETSDVRVMRDPTRGGMGAVLNEIAAVGGIGIELDEPRIPIDSVTQSACELLGLDPMFVANEGKLVAIVAEPAAGRLVAAMRVHPLGANAAIIGRVTEANPGILVARTAIGGRRVIAVQIGEQLPRIC